jgi:hypothetical protein
VIVRNGWLLAGGLLSLLAAVAHLACIVGGSNWYRALGAGERLARAAERGAWGPALITLCIAAVLALWGGYALAGAGVLPRLPLMRAALVAITGVYLLRGAVLFVPSALRRPDLSPAFIAWSSSIVLTIGAVHAVGTWRGWHSFEGVS